MNAGQFDRAQALLEEALDLASEEDLCARIELSLALVMSQTKRTADALDLCVAAAGRPGLSRETVGLLHSQRALILMLHGETSAALREFELALDALEDDLLLGRVHLNRGNVFLQQGRPSVALPDFERAEHHFRQVDNDYLTAKAAHNLGYARLLEGDLVGALQSMDAAHPYLAPDGAVMEAVINQDRAEALIAAGLVTEGCTVLRDAARTFSRSKLHRYQADAELVLARTLVRADPEAALKAARIARHLFERVDSRAWAARAEAVVVAAEVELGRRGPALVHRSDALAAELDEQGLRWGADQVRLHAARVMVRRGSYSDARLRVDAVRPGSHAPLGVRLLSRTARAELAHAQGRNGTALQHIRAGVGELHAWQSTFGSLDLQTGVVGQGRRLAVLGLRLAVDSGDPAVLYEWSERGRMLASRILPVRPPVDEQTAADLAELRQLQAGGDDVQVPRPRREAELRRRVRERAWHNPGSGEVTEPAPLADVRRELGTDTALVAWVISADRVVGLVVTDAGERKFELGTFARVRELLAGLLPDLDMAATTLPDALADVVRRGLAARLQTLADLLVTPLLESIGDRRVVVTPSGGLAGTPWSLLPGLVGRSVTVAGSATSWLSARQRPLSLERVGLVAGPRVPRAVEEVTAAAKGWASAEVLTGDAATADEVTALAGRVDVLHVAAHGRHSAENPLFSGLELVGGPWFGYDVDALPEVPQVVLLSACEVGRSSVRFGDELIGMTSAWLHAGARCVIASPTAVADDAAHDVLTHLHEGLAAGLDPSAALAAAVATGTTTGAPAPFVCFGAGW